MDLKHITTTTPDSDGETPLHSQLVNPLSSFPKGNKHHHHHPPPPPPTAVAYRECLKNHAATIGSHAVDGCGEFMHSPSTEPTSLKCAACGCHRNFHRRDPTNDSYATNKTHFIDSSPQPTNYAYAPHVLLSLSTTAAEQNHTVAIPGTPAAIKIENPNGRKRFRTKFSQDQKEKMSLFAEKLGWKMQRCDDKLVADFCNELGIRRGIFKVWMHNNKNTFGKKEKDTIFPTTTTGGGVATTTATVGISSKSINIFNNGRPVTSSYEEDINVDRRDNSNSSDQENGGGGGGRCGGGVHLQASTNGSSSSC